MRFLIATTHQDESVAIASISEGDWRATPRALRLVTHHDSGVTYPLPPSDEVPPPNEPHYALCNGEVERIHTLFKQIVEQRDPPEGGMVAFGRYLFTVLLGNDSWEQIVNRASGDWIELALVAEASTAYLQRLPWEMMHCRDGFLAAGARGPELEPLQVAITRLMSGNSKVPVMLKREPRVLFVIGSLLSDQRISPGAEYLGLIRALEVETPGGSRCMQSRILENASPSSLKAIVSAFQPDVVHFISHGKATPSQPGYLELQRDQDDPERYREPIFRCYAQNIIALLKGPDGALPLPQAVILSACESGKAWGTDKEASLAAELVENGILIVVGMGGEVSDLACRLFTRSFGTALLAGKPIVPASAYGRLAAFREEGGVDPEQAVDWAFPQLHLATGVPSGFSLLPADLMKGEKSFQRALGDYRVDLRYEPRFATRFECIEAFYDLLAPDSYEGVLALIGNKGYGKTRLLQEMTVIALRGGHLPVTLLDLPAGEIFEDLEKVLETFEGALLNTRDAHDLHDSDNMKVMQVRLLQDWDGEGDPPAGLASSVKESLRFGVKVGESPLTTLAVLKALAEDMTELLAAARVGGGRHISDHGVPVLLLDDLDNYPKQFVAELFTKAGSRNTTSRYGIGVDTDLRIPVVAAAPYEGHTHSLIKKAVDQRSKWVKVDALEPFPCDQYQEVRVYERVLLHPFNPDLLATVSNCAWIRNPTPDEDHFRVWWKLFDKLFSKIPADFQREELYHMVEMGEQMGVFIKADDDEILRRVT